MGTEPESPCSIPPPPSPPSEVLTPGAKFLKHLRSKIAKSADSPQSFSKQQSLLSPSGQQENQEEERLTENLLSPVVTSASGMPGAIGFKKSTQSASFIADSENENVPTTIPNGAPLEAPSPPSVSPTPASLYSTPYPFDGSIIRDEMNMEKESPSSPPPISLSSESKPLQLLPISVSSTQNLPLPSTKNLPTSTPSDKDDILSQGLLPRKFDDAHTSLIGPRSPNDTKPVKLETDKPHAFAPSPPPEKSCQQVEKIPFSPINTLQPSPTSAPGFSFEKSEKGTSIPEPPFSTSHQPLPSSSSAHLSQPSFTEKLLPPKVQQIACEDKQHSTRVSDSPLLNEPLTQNVSGDVDMSCSDTESENSTNDSPQPSLATQSPLSDAAPFLGSAPHADQVTAPAFFAPQLKDAAFPLEKHSQPPSLTPGISAPSMSPVPIEPTIPTTLKRPPEILNNFPPSSPPSSRATTKPPVLFPPGLPLPPSYILQSPPKIQQIAPAIKSPEVLSRKSEIPSFSKDKPSLKEIQQIVPPFPASSQIPSSSKDKPSLKEKLSKLKVAAKNPLPPPPLPSHPSTSVLPSMPKKQKKPKPPAAPAEPPSLDVAPLLRFRACRVKADFRRRYNCDRSSPTFSHKVRGNF